MKKKTKKLIASNRRAHYEYEISDTFEAGLALTGTEVKSLRQGHAVITDGYVQIKNDEAWIYQIHINEYSHGHRDNHEPKRPRKLLLSHREIQRIKKKVAQNGFSAIPISLYFQGPWAKLEIGIGRGKKLYDKRQSEKEKTQKREMRRLDY